ncbi:transporter [Desulfolithobacter dissulfuricans]|uniref:Transporter n=1 Tax=Desulfolithobacter dissulfuricans TaxID=2795293 RepID=A0A915U0Z0_9BACT|nr:cation diffusion facilitator family transporter [Desulfolithobacter dissulfuricans]BCO09473.1 transporter [Desulfolithobacter dissulfuricans]
MSHGANSLRSIFFALGANLAIFGAKLVAALITGSGALMAEAVHSLADSGNQLLLLLGLRAARKPPSPDYPLGHGKAVYFWSFIVAVILFSMGGLFSIYEGIHKLHHPEEVTTPLVAIGVLVFSLVAEGVSLWGCMREVNRVRRGRSLSRWFRETRQSELLVVFGEDSAALLGLFLALVAVILTMITGNPVYDAMGSITIGVLLVGIALAIGYEVHNLLIGQGVAPDVRREMHDFLAGRPEIEEVYNLLTLQLGPDVMVAVKARMRDSGSAREMVRDINQCEAMFKDRFSQVVWLFFEPDITD